MALNVLIVDDSVLTRKKIRRIIEMVDLEVGQFMEAGNGVQALNILDGSEVDLVLADLNMPDMGGAEMIHRMRSNEATKLVPVVVVSTESKTTRVKELLAEGVKDYLHKPFTPEEFRDTIQNVWNRPKIETKNVSEALTEALEVMAFLTAMPMEEDLTVPEETILAEIDFMGARNGSIQIIAGLDFSRILAENIGNLDDPGREEACDALQELSNVTCGLFLPILTSTTAESFAITVPRIQTCDNSSQWYEFIADQNSVVSNIEGYMVATRLILKD
jgi:two-component system chemotaxis response regulator CheY